MPYIRYMQNQEKYLVHGLRQLLIHDLYSALPELNPDYRVQNDEPAENLQLSSGDEKEMKRGIGAIFPSATDTMRKTESEVKNTLSQYQDDILMFGKYSVKSLKTVIDTLNSLHDRQTELEKIVTTKLFTEVKHAGYALDYSVELQLFLELVKAEHVTKYKEVDKAERELLDAIAILSQRRLPRSLFPEQRLKVILTEVDKMIKKNYPDYELAANHISHYRDMELVTFSVDRVTHSLIVTFPTVPPVISDGGRNVLLANFHGPRSLKCTSINGGLAKPAPEHTYTVVNREFLCDCQLDLEHASVLRQLSSCNKDKSSK